MNVDKMRRAKTRVAARMERKRIAALYARLREDNRNPRPLLTPEQTAVLREYMRRNDRAGNTVAHKDVLRHLAAVYADHPDYRQEWKP